MKRFLLCLLAAAPVAPLFAVYAPIPEQEKGKALTFSVEGGVYYDTNVFCAADDALSSWAYQVHPRAVFNASVTEQTFCSASYDVDYHYVTDRPGTKSTFIHTIKGRLAHAFSDVTDIDLSDEFSIAQNPESLRGTNLYKTKQSYRRNLLHTRYNTSLGPRLKGSLKYRNMVYDYSSDMLGKLLDRMEQLGGVELDFSALPELSCAFEYRYQDIGYRHNGRTDRKDKWSHFMLAGCDYQAGKKLLASVRVGSEERIRAGYGHDSSPYAEATLNYNYTEKSFLAVGYAHATEETANVNLYTDTTVNRYFANIQHRLTGSIALSASLTYENCKLNLPAGGDLPEDWFTGGIGATWFCNESLSIIATIDVDKGWSADDNRDLSRTRSSLTARWTY